MAEQPWHTSSPGRKGTASCRAASDCGKKNVVEGLKKTEQIINFLNGVAKGNRNLIRASVWF